MPFWSAAGDILRAADVHDSVSPPDQKLGGHPGMAGGWGRALNAVMAAVDGPKPLRAVDHMAFMLSATPMSGCVFPCGAQAQGLREIDFGAEAGGVGRTLSCRGPALHGGFSCGAGQAA
jgi:hypothetical protein